MPPDVSIIVVSYNTRELTLACLRSVIEQTRPGTFELIVIDNASEDGSPDAIAESFPDLRLIRSPENLGFAGANNLAAREATGRYLLLLNPDTLVRDGAINKLLDFAREHPDARIWGGRTVFADGTLNPTSCWRRQSCWSLTTQALGLNVLFASSELFNPETFGRWARDRVRRVDIVSGCFFLIERELWAALDGFDPAFFMYGEEADLCLRAHAFGARPMVTPNATIVHYGGASERVRGDKIAKVLIARTTLMHRHWRPTQVAFGLLMVRVRVLLRFFGYKAAARFGRAGASEQAKAWGAVWAQRERWTRGAPSTASTATVGCA
ncbi:MAG: glycosyltransferase family 2 protein [Phycisphaerales bacterium]|nr:MAG: glycosyltransferase family 2 protein [Phycisphaerales bacterium]